MTGPRVQIGPIAPERRRPQARPVDSFVRPQTSASAGRLAEALAPLSSTAASLAGVLVERRDEGDLTRGRREARDIAAEGLSFREAIRQGRITADQSPFFRIGVEEQFGRITADKYYASLLDAMANDEKMRSSTDPTDFEDFANAFRAQFLADTVGEDVSDTFEQGFGPKAEAHTQNARLAFTSRTGGQLINQAKEQMFTELVGVIENNLLLGDEVADAEFLNDIKLTMDRALAMGMTGTEVNSLVSRVVTNIAVDQDNTELLDILDKIPAGPGSVVGNREETIGLVRDARDRIARQRRQERTDEAQARAVAQNAKNEASTVQLTEAFLNGTVNLEDLLRENPTFGQHIQQQYAALQELRFGSDQGVVQQLLTRIDLFGPEDNYYVSKFTLSGAVQAGQIDGQDYITLSNRLQRRDEMMAQAAEIGDPNKDSAFLFYQREMDSFFGKDPESGQYPPGVADAAILAHARFREANIAFRTSDKGRDVEHGEYNKWLHDTMREIAQPLRDQYAVEADEEIVRSFGELERTPDWVNNQAMAEPLWREVQFEIFSMVDPETPLHIDDVSERTLSVLHALGIRDNETLTRFIQSQLPFFPGFGFTEGEDTGELAGPSEPPRPAGND